MKAEKYDLFIKLIPDQTGYLSTLDRTAMFDSDIYLSFIDSPDNYIEVTEEEYLEFKEKEQN